MTTETDKTTTKSTPRTSEGGREAIGVRKIRFAKPTDLPGKSVADGLEAHNRERLFDDKGKRTPLHGYLVEYRPWMRNFAIVYHPAGGSLPPVTVFVPESNVTVWEAL